jgi:hypothetical protein
MIKLRKLQAGDNTDPMFVLPYGVQGEINCDTQQFAIVENGVVE